MVYVDDMEHPYANMLMFHMIADTTAELLEMVDRIGVQRKWIQYPGSAKEHFDIAKVKRALAVRAGAREITWRQAGLMVWLRSRGESMGDPEAAEERFRLLRPIGRDPTAHFIDARPVDPSVLALTG